MAWPFAVRWWPFVVLVFILGYYLVKVRKAVINLEKNIAMRLETGLRLEPYSTTAAAATAVTAAAAAISIR
jgi:hypothetical protein